VFFEVGEGRGGSIWIQEGKRRELDIGMDEIRRFG